MPVCIIPSMSVRERGAGKGGDVHAGGCGQQCPHGAASHTVFNGKPTLGDGGDGEQHTDCCVYQFQIASYTLS